MSFFQKNKSWESLTPVLCLLHPRGTAAHTQTCPIPLALLSCVHTLRQAPTCPCCWVWGSSPCAGGCRAQPCPPRGVELPPLRGCRPPAASPGSRLPPSRAGAGRVPLTAEGVGEAVPGAGGPRRAPAPGGGGGQPERGAKGADEQVADGDVKQQQVDGGAQRPVAPEEQQDQKVAAEAQAAHGAQADRRRQPPGGTQARPRLRPRVAGTGRGPAAGSGGGHRHLRAAPASPAPGIAAAPCRQPPPPLPVPAPAGEGMCVCLLRYTKGEGAQGLCLPCSTVWPSAAGFSPLPAPLGPPRPEG